MRRVKYGQSLTIQPITYDLSNNKAARNLKSTQRTMKKLKVIDLFCGSGGFTLGFLSEKYNVELAVDIDPYCQKVYQKNLPNVRFELRDISSLDKKMFAGLKPDVVVGGPPCQGFSNANRWHKNYSDPRNLLFLKFIEFVKLIRPKMVLIENVSGILSKSNGEIIKKIKKY